MSMQISWNEWKNWNSLKAFDDSYPQKIRMAFFFLSNEKETSLNRYFDLKDFVSKGADILSYLGIGFDTEDSIDSLMNVYGRFDRNGKGSVRMEEFVIGVLGFVCSMRQNIKLLEEIAKDMLLIESRCLELATLFEKIGENISANSSQLVANVTNFKNTLKPFSLYISNSIRAMPHVENLSALDASLLVGLFQTSLSRAIEESTIYFHIGSNEFNLIGDVPSSSSIGESVPLVWRVPKFENESYPWTTLTSNTLSANISESNEKLLRAASATTNNHEWRNLSSLRDHEKETLSSELVHDTAQLFLLQDAYLTIQTFFEFLTTYQPSSSSSSSNTEDINHTLKEQLKFLAIPHQRHDQGLGAFPGKPFPSSRPNQAQTNAGGEDTSSSTDLALRDETLPNILTQELLSTQENLRRVQSRLELLESIQSHIMCDYLYQQRSLHANASQVSDLPFPLANHHSHGAEEHHPSTSTTSSAAAVSLEGQMVEDFRAGQRFEDILQELQQLECQIADRGHAEYAFGLLLKEPVVIIGSSGDEKQTISTAATDSSSGSGGPVEHLFDHVKQQFKELQSLHLGTLESLKAHHQHQQEAVQQLHKQSQLQHKQEQVESEHAELLKLTLEVQILREQNLLLMKQQQENHSLLDQNRELHKLVLSLQEQLRGANDLPSKDATATSFAMSKRNDPSGAAEDRSELRDQYQKVLTQNQQLQQQNDALSKENSRAKSTVQQTEAHIKSILQDSLALHQQIHSLQEETSNQGNKILQLTQQYNDASHYKQLWHEQEKQILELKRESMKKDVAIQELKENMTLLDKYHSDLLQAERTIETLETKINEFAVELEKGVIVNNQLAKLRDLVQRKTNENNNLMLKIYQLENSNQDIPYYTGRIQEMVEEISDMKIKIEKIPGLLAEIARLRGSSRAALRSLSEQDKVLGNYKTRIKSLEKENFLLKQDNQSLQDLENKLKDSNNEIKRLMTILNEIQAMKLNAKNVEEEKKIMEGHYKKMRKFMRQSVLTAPINSPTGVSNSTESQSES